MIVQWYMYVNHGHFFKSLEAKNKKKTSLKKRFEPIPLDSHHYTAEKSRIGKFSCDNSIEKSMKNLSCFIDSGG